MSTKPKSIETEIIIDAPLQKVWDVLVDAAKWKDWNPSFHIGGSPPAFVLNEPCEFLLYNKPNAKPMVAHPVIQTLDADKKVLMWKGVLGGAEWVFYGLHVFELLEQEGNKTKMLHHETMHGLMFPILRLTGAVESTKKLFLNMNEALKERCERGDS